MENIVNTFYKGNINKFGFGGWNTTKNNIKEVLESYPYPSNANRNINKYFQKSNVDKNNNLKQLHEDYVPHEYNSVFNEKIDFSKSNAQEIRPLSMFQYKNFYNYGFMNTQTKNIPETNFSPALIRMEYLEKKVHDLELKDRNAMMKSLEKIKDTYIGDSRFKQFLDKNQNQYNVYGYDYDPLLDRRNYIQTDLNNIRNIHNKSENRRIKKIKKNKKKKQKNKKNKKNNLFEDTENSTTSEKTITNTNANTNVIPSMQNTIGDNNNMGGISRNSQKNTDEPPRLNLRISSQISRRSSVSKSKINTIKNSVIPVNENNVNNSAKRNSLFSGVGNNVNNNVNNNENNNQEKKEKKEKKPSNMKVCGDIGLGFVSNEPKIQELQKQTNRLGRDFDKVLNQMRDFKSYLKDKMEDENNFENGKLNAWKNIFLLNDRQTMINAVDKIINRNRNDFDYNQYKKNLDEQNQREINFIIDKKLKNYNKLHEKLKYQNDIINEPEEMEKMGKIRKLEYQKYQERMNSQITKLPPIFIKPTIITEQYKQEKKNKITENEREEKGIIIEEKNIENKKENLEEKEKKRKRIYYGLHEDTVNTDLLDSSEGYKKYRTRNKHEVDGESVTINFSNYKKKHKNKRNKKKNKKNDSIKETDEGEEEDGNKTTKKKKNDKSEKEKNDKKTKDNKKEEEESEKEKEEEEEENKDDSDTSNEEDDIVSKINVQKTAAKNEGEQKEGEQEYEIEAK